jgi:hypothetical protein
LISQSRGLGDVYKRQETFPMTTVLQKLAYMLSCIV